ncbi:heparan sulfate 2-O-sulfotransferase 1 [Galendromus occidentalis]|uniref:Heparan sulfate 2-O-sulfotransferase 1 n=1 Tax=Galendromus occidentalis TaxID=34638 RepID=A0AAJ7L5K7_9ACAR|nr:heparan sulfate 2-O-sulfotransferase 1 [Galendromus occidentalis]
MCVPDKVIIKYVEWEESPLMVSMGSACTTADVCGNAETAFPKNSAEEVTGPPKLRRETLQLLTHQSASSKHYKQDVTTRSLEMFSSVARTPALWRVFAGLVFFGVWFLLFTELEHRMRTIEETNQYMGKMLARLNFNRYSAIGEQSSQNEDLDESLGLPLKTFENQVIIYNRVPKTASTSFTGVAYDLCVKNKFFVLHINTSRNMHVMSIADQMRYSVNISQWESMRPSMYHGHVAFLDFARFGMPPPIYINIVREPLERLVSYYYFLRNGDDFRPHLQRRRSGDKRTFDECVKQMGQDCSEDKMWLQIPFFCGHTPNCWQPGSRWALEQAKMNLINKYLLVGTTEQLQDFVDILEVVLPRFFRGASQLFHSGKKSHLRKTSNKKPVNAETVALIKQWPTYLLESEFYEFAKRHFNSIKDKLNSEQGSQQFFFEKIRPKKRW